LLQFGQQLHGFHTIGIVRQEANTATKLQESISTSTIREPTSNGSLKLASSCLEYLRQSEIYNGVSEEAATFIEGRNTEFNSTIKQQDYRWKKFSTWWNQQNFGDTIISPDRVVNFLYGMYLEGYNYDHITSFRSTISVTVPAWQGVTIEQCALVCKCHD
jgi:hypothetical protein